MMRERDIIETENSDIGAEEESIALRSTLRLSLILEVLLDIRDLLTKLPCQTDETILRP